MKLTPELIHGFSETILAKKYDQRKGTPACHLEWWDLCCSDASLVAIAAPRGHAKSTAITHAYVLASVLFRDRKFPLIISDTYDQAVLFLKDIANELKENEDIHTLFDVNPVFEKDSENDIIVNFNDGEQFRIMAKGSEQKVRGLKWRSKRPDLIVGDDLENDEIVMNDDRRKKFQSWFLNALLPCRGDNGIVRIVGTILHMDSLLENLMPPLFDKKYTVTEPLRMYSTNPRRAWRSYRYRAHVGLNDFSQILWESKWPESRLRAERQKYLDAGNAEGYSQEYLNYPIDETRAFFRRGDFIPMTEVDKERFKNYYVAVDPAITENERSDYSVFIVGGVDENGVLHVVDVVRERMDSRDIIETFFILQKKYDPELFIIEAGAIEKSIGPFLRAEMLKPGRQPLSIETKVPSKDKEFRARSIQARMRAGGVRFDKSKDWYPEFEMECCQFPRGKHDDQVDAFAWLGLTLDKMQDAPTKREMEQADLEDELAAFFSNGGFNGRSMTTGY
jgi:phage uncharacterized protein (putative large terminase), C-terminal domain